MNNVPSTNPLANPGVEAALVRLGFAVRDFAETTGKAAPSPYTDKIAISTALVYVGSSILCGTSPTEAVSLLDELRERCESVAASFKS